jgi:hypothetical protein
MAFYDQLKGRLAAKGTVHRELKLSGVILGPIAVDALLGNRRGS